MATILSGNPPTYNKNDVAGTVKALCNYTRSLQENLDFLISQIQKDLKAAQGDIEGLNGQVSSLDGRLNGLQSTVESMDGQITSLANRVTALEQAAQ